MTLTIIDKAETYEDLSNMFLTILLGSLAFLTVLVFVHGFGVVGWIPEYITVLNLVQGILLGSLFILPSYLLGGFFGMKASKLKEVHAYPPSRASSSATDGSLAEILSSAQGQSPPPSFKESKSGEPPDIFEEAD